MKIRKNVAFWAVAIIGLIVDYVSKRLAVALLMPISADLPIPLIPSVLNLTYTENTGAAFGLFKNHGEWLWILSLAVSAALIAMGLTTRFANAWEEVGYGFILSGALGNGIDRALSGAVVDFIQVFPVTGFPVFNFADIWINIGFVCLVWVLLTESQRG